MYRDWCGQLRVRSGMWKVPAVQENTSSSSSSDEQGQSSRRLFDGPRACGVPGIQHEIAWLAIASSHLFARFLHTEAVDSFLIVPVMESVDPRQQCTEAPVNWIPLPEFHVRSSCTCSI